MKYCKKCNQSKSLSEFGVHKRRKDGLRGYCRECEVKSTRAWQKNIKNNPREIPDFKLCIDCNENKNQIEFTRHRFNKDGLNTRCKECDAIKELERKYNFTKEQASKIYYEDRHGNCKICNLKSVLVVDHCHKKGHVRGLLCKHCNSMLGMAKDNIQTLENAIKYLEETQ